MVALVVTYLLGVLVLLIRLAVGTAHALKLRRGAVVQAGRPTSPRCATPVTVGWWSPVLILPDGWERWSAARLDAVVAHEGAHARRHDPLVQWLALLNRAIFWFHPVAWWLERRLAHLAEEVCDRAVIGAGHSPQDYSGYLIEMARALSRQGRRLNVAGMAMPGGNLAYRMRQILEEAPMRPPTRARVISTLALCVTSSIVCAAAILAPRTPVAASTQANRAATVNVPTTSPSLPAPQAPDGKRIARAEGLPSSSGSARQEGVTVPQPLGQVEAKTVARPSVSLEQPRADSPTRVENQPAPGAAPDLSGHWSLVSSTYAGRGRGGRGEAGVEREVTTKWVSGAPVNCGPECTITQDAKTMTISRLGTPDAVTLYDNGVVVLNLDGTESAVTQSSGSHYIVHAKWNGDRLVVTYESAYFTVTQVLSIENGRLKVVTDFSVGDAPVTFTYVKR